ncbi:MAG TPA: peptidoglycan-binding domain-containing protein [Gammaproteobacteria bacterium]|nr:peptidoglycan-binding domain-containing protein [Gammaproteobacteria bacterium]
MNKVVILGFALASVLTGPAALAEGAAPAAAKANPTVHHEKVKEHAGNHIRAAHQERHRITKGETKSAQTALNAHGASLKVDGVWGKKTRAAIANFQKHNGLKATGHLDRQTRAKLGLS